MSRYQSHPNTDQRYARAVNGVKFRRDFPHAARILTSLKARDFQVLKTDVQTHLVRIRLRCGAVVSVYKTGTVLTQGRIRGCGAEGAAALLQSLLPTPHVWQVHVDG